MNIYGQVNLEEYRQSIIDSFSTYQEIYGIRGIYCHLDWCEDGIRRAKEAKTLTELEMIDDKIKRAWDAISD